MKPIVAITMGDPVGVGPELVLRALNSRKVRRAARPVVIGDLNLLGRLARKLSLRAPRPGEVAEVTGLSGFKGLKRLTAGSPTPESAAAMVSYIEEAALMAMRGEADAVVTAPINKASARLAGFKSPGHTEFLARLTKTSDFVMMLNGPKLKVALVTIHEPIKKVPRLITGARVLKTIKITNDSLKRFFRIKRPRIAVCGLNPHAGEGGLMGAEDKLVIAPAIKKARKAGIDTVGPLPPDTVFFRAVTLKDFDCVVAMYHDQGLIPLKLLHFECGVNTTLGLPIIRTSPDHGTAYDIAWKGVASAESMIAAIVQAAEMAEAGRRNGRGGPPKWRGRGRRKTENKELNREVLLGRIYKVN